MEKTRHWEKIYQTKSSTEVSWYETDPIVSMDLILSAVGDFRGRVIDIGGGQSFLVDRLLAEGFPEIAVLDISNAAIEETKRRLGEKATSVRWIVADIASTNYLGIFDVWHDRAVFHFLTEPPEIRHYVELLTNTLPCGGHFIVSTFAIGGPEKCSGLPICQYDASKMSDTLGQNFELIHGFERVHLTPSGTAQLFFHGIYRRK